MGAIQRWLQAFYDQQEEDLRVWNCGRAHRWSNHMQYDAASGALGWNRSQFFTNITASWDELE